MIRRTVCIGLLSFALGATISEVRADMRIANDVTSTGGAMNGPNTPYYCNPPNPQPQPDSNMTAESRANLVAAAKTALKCPEGYVSDGKDPICIASQDDANGKTKPKTYQLNCHGNTAPADVTAYCSINCVPKPEPKPVGGKELIANAEDPIRLMLQSIE